MLSFEYSCHVPVCTCTCIDVIYFVTLMRDVPKPLLMWRRILSLESNHLNQYVQRLCFPAVFIFWYDLALNIVDTSLSNHTLFLPLYLFPSLTPTSLSLPLSVFHVFTDLLCWDDIFVSISKTQCPLINVFWGLANILFHSMLIFFRLPLSILFVILLFSISLSVFLF